MKRLLGVWAAIAAMTAGCELPHSGERGGFEQFAAIFEVRDDATGKALQGVQIEIADGLRTLADVGRTDEFGEYAFRKRYGRSKASGLIARSGYPRAFTIGFEKEGYQTLILVIDERPLRFGLDRSMSFRRKEIRLKRGHGVVKVDERRSGD